MTLFSPGVVVATSGALEAFREAGESVDDSPLPILSYLVRHLAGDWGDVDDHDLRANDAALRHGERLLSAYTLPGGRRIWIITESDRSSTTILLPEEY